MVLLSVGQLGHSLGHLAEAEQDIRAAMNVPASSLGRAEQAFYLGQVLIDAGRFVESEAMFARALREAPFGAGVAEARARIAEKQGRWAEALEHIREMRRLLPRDLGVLLRFASIARKAGADDQAEEALRWAILVAPEDESPRIALVEMLLAREERHLAARALEDYIRSFGRTPDAVRLEEALGAPLDPAVR
jgi:tetratricopeptide (TPR) repeat protein